MTSFLAQFFGIYFAILCLALVFKKNRMRSTAWQMVSQPPVLMLSAIFTLILGIFLVLLHPVWEWDLAVVITILSWIILLKGIFLLFFPEKAELTLIFLHSSLAFYSACVFYAIMAAGLLWYGFCYNAM